jgi:hypothetical protein
LRGLPHERQKREFVRIVRTRLEERSASMTARANGSWRYLCADGNC